MTANFYLLPLEQIGQARGPKYLKWRYGDGLPDRWSLTDFDRAPIGLVATEAKINRPDALPLNDWSSKQRDQVSGYLRSAGLEPGWATRAANWREGLHRLAGLALAHQAGQDDPAAWLGRDIYFGFVALQALDQPTWHKEQAAQAIPPLRVRDNFRPGWNWGGLLRAMVMLPFAALPATDAFTGTNGTILTTYSANWTLNSGSMDIQTNAISPNSAGADSLAHWNADTFANDQYALGTVAAVSSGWIGVACRVATSAFTGYLYYGNSGNRTIAKYVAGTYTDLGLYQSGGFAVSDTVRIEASGTTITPIRNGATDTNTGQKTDSSIASGYGGLITYDDDTASRIDTWEGGNLGAATKSLPRFHRKNYVFRRRF